MIISDDDKDDNYDDDVNNDMRLFRSGGAALALQLQPLRRRCQGGER